MATLEQKFGKMSLLSHGTCLHLRDFAFAAVRGSEFGAGCCGTVVAASGGDTTAANDGEFPLLSIVSIPPR